MDEKIYISVRDRQRGDAFVTSITLPASIGKQSGAGNAILLAADYPAISRRHGSIERTAGRLVYRDTSTNGSRVDGQPVRGASMPLGDRFEIEIGPYLLSRIEARPFSLLLTDGSRTELERRDLLEGHGVGVRELAGRLTLTDLNRWSERERTQSIQIRVAGGEIRLGAAGGATKINRRALQKESEGIAPGDVIEHAGHRIEVLGPGVTYSVCGNTACQLLNSHTSEGSCRWCGFHLSSTGAISRVIL